MKVLLLGFQTQAVDQNDRFPLVFWRSIDSEVMGGELFALTQSGILDIITDINSYADFIQPVKTKKKKDS